MARMRTLKPTFFQNERLADLQPLCRLLFQGLWCLADREGRLEDRPRRIKAEALPYDDCDVEQFLDDLAAAGFIERYEAAGMRLIQVLKFRKHQTPHIKETASTLPAPVEHWASTVQAPEDHHSSTPSNGEWVVGSGVLVPGSGGAGGETAAATPSAEPAAPSAPPVKSAPPVRVKPVPKQPTGEDLAPLIDAFRAAGLSPPALIRGEPTAAQELLRHYSAEQLAACWQDHASGDYGDDFSRRTLSLVYLANNNRVGNWLAWKAGTNGSDGHGENRQHSGRAGAGSGRARAGTGAGSPGEADPFAKFVIRDEPASGDPGSP